MGFQRFYLIFILLVGLSKGSVDMQEEETPVIQGTKVSLPCSLNFSVQQVTLLWSFNNGSILLHDPLIHEFNKTEPNFNSVIGENGTEITLTIQNVQIANAGKYSCKIFFRTTGTSVAKFWTLTVQGKPRIHLAPNISTEGEPMLAKCCVEHSNSIKEINIKWLIDRSSNFSVTSEVSERPSGVGKDKCNNIVLRAARVYNQQRLQCLVENQLNLSSSFMISVLYPPDVNIVSPFYHLVEENDEINITCIANGNPIPSVQLQYQISQEDWVDVRATSSAFHEGGAISVNSFLLINIRKNQSGSYRCNAFNNIGTATSSLLIQVDVIYLDGVQLLTKSPLKVRTGAAIFISCQSYGIPSPEIMIQKHTQEKQWVTLPIKAVNVSNHAPSSTWMFHFSVKSHGVGRFRCIANNTGNKTVWSKSLIVEYKSFVTVLMEFILSNLEIVIAVSVGIVVMITVILLRVKHRKNVPYDMRAASERLNQEREVAYLELSQTNTTSNITNDFRPVPPTPRNTDRTQISLQETPKEYEELPNQPSYQVLEEENVTVNVDTLNVKYASVQKQALRVGSSD